MLRYNLEALAAARVLEVDGEPTWLPTTVDSLAEVRFELVLANDYRVEVASNRQTNIEAQPVVLLVESAPGNVGDTSNRRTVRFDYGLPTANQLAGLTLEVRQLWGFDLYAELNVNHRFAQYPSPLLTTPPHLLQTGPSVDGQSSANARTLFFARRNFQHGPRLHHQRLYDRDQWAGRLRRSRVLFVRLRG